jgi:hypothetical protein
VGGRGGGRDQGGESATERGVQEKAARGGSGERGIEGRGCSISAAAASTPRGHVISFGVAINIATAVFAEPLELFLTVSRLRR